MTKTKKLMARPTKPQTYTTTKYYHQQTYRRAQWLAAFIGWILGIVMGAFAMRTWE